MNRCFVVCGLGYGDEGKGGITAALVERYEAGLVVRYNGGSQCAHNVVTDDGRHHTFAQFGSGTFSKAETLLGKDMLFNPWNLAVERNALSGNANRVYVDCRAIVTTPYHVALNRIREMARGENRHGSCGMGIGETRIHSLLYPEEAIRASDFNTRSVLIEKLIETRNRLRDEAYKLMNDHVRNHPYIGIEFSRFNIEPCDIWKPVDPEMVILHHEQIKTLLDKNETVVFEGAQGVLLDETHGFAPYTTWSNTTTDNAVAFLREFGEPDEQHFIGVTRAYASRHGPGPFPTECEALNALKVYDHNSTGEWQGGMRYGFLDIPALHYAKRLCKLTSLAVTHIDSLEKMNRWPVCVRYEDFKYPELQLSQEKWAKISERMMLGFPMVFDSMKANNIPSLIQGELELPIAIESHGATSSAKKFFL